MSIQKVYVGDFVTFVDSKGYPLNALITSVFGRNSIEERNANYQEAYERGDSWASEEWLKNALAAPYTPPSINVVYVANDETQNDSYGRQIARSTSVPHQSVQPAPGYY